ncbi:unnamed protein product [Mytilus edulis]|uniref:G-protein coupled receptors family 1 profile domain-containing protein n=1 Tax=Mytilus edulis TaxID=6550 RepID=A0A8S3SN90_MYTED|nr:unnamed protein product [Mytilus edulis]
MNTSIMEANESVTEDMQLNATNDLEDWPKVVETYLIGNSVFLAVCMVIGVIGNAIVVAVYKLEMKDTSTERYFIPVLAGADILATIVGCITCTIWNSLQSSFTSNNLCKVILFSIASSASFCLFLFLCIAFQRYLLICRRYQLNLLQRRIMIGVSAILGIVKKKKLQMKESSREYTRSLSDKKSNDRTEDTPAKTCEIKINSISQEDVNFPSTDHHNDEALQRNNKSDTQNIKPELPSVESTVSKKEPSTQSGRKDTRNKRNRRFKTKFSLMFVVVTSVSIVCYLPVGAIVMLEGFIPEFWDNLTQMELIIVVWFYRSYIINSIANPIIYAFLDIEFYNGLKRLYQRCFQNEYI